MSEAARLDDAIGHSSALRGMVLGTLVGGAIAAAGAVAAGALFFAGLAACVVGGAALIVLGIAVGAGTSMLAGYTRDLIADACASSLSKEGAIATGSGNVYINGKKAARAVLSGVTCAKDGPSMQVAGGSDSVYINGQPAARNGDKVNCGGAIMEGSPDVFIGGGTKPVLPVKPEVPSWLYKASDLTLLLASLVGGVSSAFRPGAFSQFLNLPLMAKLMRNICRYGMLMLGVEAAGIIARPVDIVSGQKFLAGDDECDFVLPSRLPVRWQRYWRSGNPCDGVLGRGWSLFWETRLVRHDGVLALYTPAGDWVSVPPLPEGTRSWCPALHRWLEHHTDGSWSVSDISGGREVYSALSEAGEARLSHLTDAFGNRTQCSWNRDGTLASLLDSAGQQVTCCYDAGRLTGVWRDETTCLVSYAYDAQRQLMTVIGRGGIVRRRFSWQDGLMAGQEDVNGLHSEYEWQEIDGIPRVTAYRNSAGEQLTLAYDFAGQRRMAHRDDGCRALWELDGDDNVIRFTDYDGRVTEMRHVQGELCGVTLPGGAVRETEWDSYGRLLRETDPPGNTTEYQWYRLTDNLAQIVQPDGTQIRLAYDAAGRLQQEIDPAGQETCWHYPGLDDPLPCAMTDARGGTVTFDWNEQGLLTARTDCSGQRSAFEYDRDGQLTASVDAQGHVTRREWDARGLLAKVVYPDGSRETLSWNARGQLAAWQDANHHETRWLYNVLGQPVGVKDRLARIRRWHYDARGRLLRLDNGNGAAYCFDYDPVGRLLRESRVDGTTRVFHYGEAGRVERVEHRGNTGREDDVLSHDYQYDAAGRLTARRHRHAAFYYQHDSMGRLTGLRREPTAEGLALGLDADSLHLVYGATGLPLTETGQQGTLNRCFDALGNLTGLTLPDGNEYCWLHYGSGHVSAIRFNHQLISEFTRDPLHREVTRTQGARLQTRERDSRGRLVAQRSAPDEVTTPETQLRERLFSYDPDSNITGIHDTLRGDIQCDYDPEGRLKRHLSVHWAVSRREFGYDAADNPLDAATTAPLTDNRLRKWRDLWSQYDGQGNLIRRKTGLTEQHYRYDADNRLVEARGRGPEGEFTARYRYDALGRRTQKTVNRADGRPEEVTRFLWDGLRLLQEQTAESTQSYVYEPGADWSPLARVRHGKTVEHDAEILWFSTDLNGAPLEMVDASGAIRWSGEYGPWGELKGQTRDSIAHRHGHAVAPQPLRYAGQYADGETGLHYNLFRYYDPGIGRFITQDPIGLAGGLNLYQYAPNPLSYIDPLGLSPYDPIADLNERGYTGVTKTSGGGLDYSDSNALYNKKPGVNPKVTIEYNGDYDLDYRAANAKAGLDQVSTPRGYVWHHLDDYNSVTNKGSMQLVKQDAHLGVIHKGGVSQYKTATGKTYTHPARTRGKGRCG